MPQLRSGLILPDGAELPTKTPARVVAVANLALTAPGTVIDGVTMVAGDRVLLTAQTAGAENGIYTWVSSTSLIRAVDASAAAHFFRGWEIGVVEGTSYAGSKWAHTTSGTVTLGTTTIAFARVNAAPWTTLIEAGGSLASAAVAGTFPLRTDYGALTVVATAIVAQHATFPLDSAQYTPTGRPAQQLRLVASVLNNATAPAATYTFHLYSFTTAAFVLSLTAAVGEQAAVVTTPAANAVTKTYGAAFPMPAAAGQGFALAVVTSAIGAAGATPFLGCRLETRTP